MTAQAEPRMRDSMTAQAHGWRGPAQVGVLGKPTTGGNDA
jgi:hypothetical protein